MSTVKEMWAAIVKEYTSKGMFAQTELRTKFLESRCPEKGNVKDFLDELRAKREELATMGVSISDDDYRSTIISSLPITLSRFAASTLASIRMINASHVVSPDALISSICEEYARQAVERARNPRSQPRQPGDKKDEALSVEQGGGKSGKRKPRGKCFNCGEEGHWKRNCPKPKKKRDGGSGGGESSKRVDANVVSLDDDDDAFLVGTVETDDEDDWAAQPSPAVADSDETFPVSAEYEDPEEEPSECMALDDDAALTVAVSTTRVEVFDSGAARHISPY
jgi:hypothetical protein